MTSKATFYVENDLLRAVKLKAAQTDQTLSSLVNDALRQSLREDEADIRDFRTREREPSRSFDVVLKELKRAGKL
ncbi:MAG: CopG family transcriptional regulator [Acidobacteria bacterium]|nr:CopG family transcriptional regulator [Acidobacteriota bacterium]